MQAGSRAGFGVFPGYSGGCSAVRIAYAYSILQTKHDTTPIIYMNLKINNYVCNN